jgi:hypothetical protein
MHPANFAVAFLLPFVLATLFGTLHDISTFASDLASQQFAPAWIQLTALAAMVCTSAYAFFAGRDASSRFQRFLRRTAEVATDQALGITGAVSGWLLANVIQSGPPSTLAEWRMRAMLLSILLSVTLASVWWLLQASRLEQHLQGTLFLGARRRYRIAKWLFAVAGIVAILQLGCSFSASCTKYSLSLLG